jgi:hypothetical protein
MGGACSTFKGEDNFKVDLLQVGFVGMDRTELAQERDR